MERVDPSLKAVFEATWYVFRHSSWTTLLLLIKSSLHSTIKMNPVDVKSITYIDFDNKNNKEDPKFNVGDHVKTSKHKNIFAKG